MKITWLGHSCFLLEESGYRLVVDPYDGVESYSPLWVKAHAAFCSHEHVDHNFRSGVELLPAAECPFSVREVETFHDDRRGALRGMNTVRIFTAGGRSFCHLGDLGHLLTPAQAEIIGPCDALAVPIGGVYTIDAAEARQVAEALEAGCVIPMHYHNPPHGMPALAGVEPFLRLWPAESVRRLPGSSFALDGTCRGVLVPTWQAAR